MADKKKKKASAPVDGASKEPTGEGDDGETLRAGFQELPTTAKKASPEQTPARKAADDLILAAMTADLDTFEATYGPVNVTVADSVAAGNCESGVIAWRAANAGGRVIIPAREMLAAAAESRDQISRVVLGIRRAMKRMGG